MSATILTTSAKSSKLTFTATPRSDSDSSSDRLVGLGGQQRPSSPSPSPSPTPSPTPNRSTAPPKKLNNPSDHNNTHHNKPRPYPSYSPQLLSFPATSTAPPFAFDFPLPTPARHSPPPYPGPRPVASIQPPPQSQSQSHPYPDPRRPPQSCLRAQPYPFRPSHLTFTLPLAPSRRKRAAAPPLVHSVRAKKIKLSHPFFRSSRLFYPVDGSQGLQVNSTTPTCISESPPPLIYRAMQCPRWLHTSAAAEGHSSKLCPKEAQFTGTVQNWFIVPGSKMPPFSPSRNAASQRSPPPRCPPSAIPPRTVRSPPSPGPHAAPLKAQLLAVLRMRSSLRPGEAALRLRRWVIWNSWTRGQAQRHFYPINNSAYASMLPISHPRASALTDLNGDEWTGNEMFDDNGDLVCDDEDLDGSEEIEETSYSAPVLPVVKATTTPEIVDLANNEQSSKTQRITRANVPPRINTSKYPANLTPPSSPESQKDHDDESKMENLSCNSTVDVTNQLGQIKVSKVDQKPLTPPPSPPNQTRK